MCFGLSSIALKTSSDGFIGMCTYYTNVIGGKEVWKMPGVSVFELPGNVLLEIYNDASDHPSYLFDKANIVMGFRTEDINKTFSELSNKNYTLLSPIQHAGNCYSYFHTCDPNGSVIIINQLHKN